MPTYQYCCTQCQHGFEATQAFSDPALSDCPQCQGRLRKVYSAVGVVFKGSGFYRTDSRSGPSSTAGSKGEKKAETTPSTTTSSSEKKTDTTSSTKTPASTAA